MGLRAARRVAGVDRAGHLAVAALSTPSWPGLSRPSTSSLFGKGDVELLSHAALVAGIHLLESLSKDVDARHKAGHDDADRSASTTVGIRAESRKDHSIPGYENQPHLPCPRPMLHVLFTLNRRADVVVDFEMDETLETISLGKPLNDAFMVLSDPLNEMACDADVQDAVWLVVEDGHVAVSHAKRRRRGWPGQARP